MRYAIMGHDVIKDPARKLSDGLRKRGLLGGRRVAPGSDGTGISGLHCTHHCIDLQTAHYDFLHSLVGPVILADDDRVPLSAIWGPAGDFEMLLPPSGVHIIPKGSAIVLRATYKHGGGRRVNGEKRVFAHIIDEGKLPTNIYGEGGVSI